MLHAQVDAATAAVAHSNGDHRGGDHGGGGGGGDFPLPEQWAKMERMMTKRGRRTENALDELYAALGIIDPLYNSRKMQPIINVEDLEPTNRPESRPFPIVPPPTTTQHQHQQHGSQDVE